MTVAVGPREQRRQRLLEVNREHLLDAAEEVFGAEGFQAATIKEIADRAEFSVGAVYTIVSGKDDLLRQTLARRATELLAAMEAVAAAPGSPRALLLRLADVEVEFFRRHPHFGRLWLRWAGPVRWGLAPSTVEHLGRDLDRAMAVQARLFARGQEAGELRAGDPEVLARIFSGMVQAYQASDPASVGEGADERLPITELHALIEGAFSP